MTSVDISTFGKFTRIRPLKHHPQSIRNANSTSSADFRNDRSCINRIFASDMFILVGNCIFHMSYPGLARVGGHPPRGDKFCTYEADCKNRIQ